MRCKVVGGDGDCSSLRVAEDDTPRPKSVTRRTGSGGLTTGGYASSNRSSSRGRREKQHPDARCLLQLRLPRTLTARGDRRERGAVLRALTAAEHQLNDAGTDRPAWVSEAVLAFGSGQSSSTSAIPAAPHQLICEGEGLLQPAWDKTRGVFLAYRAASYLGFQGTEPAAAAATQPLLLAHRIGARRCARLIDDPLPRFAPYTRAHGVPELFTSPPPKPGSNLAYTVTGCGSPRGSRRTPRQGVTGRTGSPSCDRRAARGPDRGRAALRTGTR